MHFPPPLLPSDMLRLPLSIIHIRRLHPPSSSSSSSSRSNSGIEWKTIEELDRHIMANIVLLRHSHRRTHDLEVNANVRASLPTVRKRDDAYSSSTSEGGGCYFTKKLTKRDPNVGLGMTLQVRNGCAYMHKIGRVVVVRRG